MPFYNYGLEHLGSYIRGLAPSNPQYMSFDAGSTLLNNAQSYPEEDKYRAVVTWNPLDLVDARGVVTIGTTELVGSGINSLGLVLGSPTLGSDLFAREITSLGSKTQYQTWSVEFDVRFRSF